MASIGNSVRKAIQDWLLGETEFAMLHACNTVDGTARRAHPDFRNKQRFTQLLRDHYPILGPMAAPGIDLANTRWPVRVHRPTAPGGKPDLADVIYGVHRCSHGHGDELPDGFQLIADASKPESKTTIQVQPGKVQLSDRVIFGLLAVAVLHPLNADQQIPENYYLTYAGQQFPVHQWWGRAADFLSILNAQPLGSLTLDFGDWMLQAT